MLETVYSGHYNQMNEHNKVQFRLNFIVAQIVVLYKLASSFV